MTLSEWIYQHTPVVRTRQSWLKDEEELGSVLWDAEQALDVLENRGESGIVVARGHLYHALYKI